ncbi:MAG: Fe-S cluster assembly protein SufD [Nitrospinae bacterium]|jgi:Fe-S cluster assembly protein SufD|nr:Fe-S cluster assembly protein SufD [Nitrospinota bacterium]MDA1109424.1 Fe-S cluster assembly protein SufD [Nitrospinota bacterium]
MTTTLAESKDQAESALLDQHKKFLSETKPLQAFLPINESAIKRFELLKFPHRKHEMYTFVNTKELVSTSCSLVSVGSVSADIIKRHIYPGCENSHLVIVDGAYKENLSDCSAISSSINIIPLAEALSEPELKNYLADTVEEENDVFACINSAFLSQGLLIDLPKKAQVPAPLQILYVSSGSPAQPVTSHPRVIVRLGAMAELKLIVKYVGVQGNYFVNSVQDFLIGEDAGMTFTQVQEDATDAWHCSKTRVALERNSRFFASNASYGSKLTRHHYDVRLKNEGAELRLNGVSVLTGEEQVHNFIRIHHEAPHCTSSQKFKNIINDKGRSSFDGTVIVNQGAQLTNADQLINNLMLSDNAHADNKPNLMIFADDVKCAHGATIGQIDEDQMFYLKTRGLSQKVAKELLTRSFAQSIIQTIEFPAVVKDLENNFLKKLEA